jgi:hypothetical protein
MDSTTLCGAPFVNENCPKYCYDNPKAIVIMLADQRAPHGKTSRRSHTWTRELFACSYRNS